MSNSKTSITREKFDILVAKEGGWGDPLEEDPSWYRHTTDPYHQCTSCRAAFLDKQLQECRSLYDLEDESFGTPDGVCFMCGNP